MTLWRPGLESKPMDCNLICVQDTLTPNLRYFEARKLVVSDTVDEDSSIIGSTKW